MTEGADSGTRRAVIDGFSDSFLHEFMEHLRRSHPHSRVAAKIVYNEYIANRHHIHMNSTKWLTLTGAACLPAISCFVLIVLVAGQLPTLPGLSCRLHKIPGTGGTL